MRKLYLSLLLPLFMLLAQQGALWHEIEHLTGGGAGQVSLSNDLGQVQGQGQASSSKAESAKESSAGTLCETCLAFAQIASVAKAEAPRLNLLRFSFASPQWESTRTLAAETPAPRSRGPPYFL